MLRVAEPFPDLPTAEKFFNEQEDVQADTILVYDYACGLLSSVIARTRYMKNRNEPVPDRVKSWAGRMKAYVDKFLLGDESVNTDILESVYDVDDATWNPWDAPELE